jgi:hypothetical protein
MKMRYSQTTNQTLSTVTKTSPHLKFTRLCAGVLSPTIPVKLKIWSAQLDAHPSVYSLFSLSQSELLLPSSLDLSPEMVVESVTATP